MRTTPKGKLFEKIALSIDEFIREYKPDVNHPLVIIRDQLQDLIEFEQECYYNND